MEMLLSLSPIILMFVIFYFLLIRPQQKKQKQVRQMQSDLQKGNSVITIGGFHGVIHAIDEDTVVIASNDGIKLTYDRSAIREVKQ
ncbi:preprotein translocase subunit YajC [Virgibacillus natechei]|uniref:Preprotein translocase subunit YajC n=1 Tax=Virgibacillus natechei TaxID=1216297 RepID=A0ABS4ICW0_9BACI|nr:preprotein translocase subunit YajC [Virgibacillus natechei]MBP1968778.1 preprotein translocase subunit YajC [Virgibacillus natechei]UZD11578.1 preprotein translocase subunit YajC [Virgibacillus natechei]